MRFIHPLALLALGVVPLTGVAASKPPAGKQPPFLCYTDEWQSSYKVVSTEFDRAANKVTWVLEAKKDLTPVRYQAFLADPDGVEAGTFDVAFDPKKAEYNKGAKITATISLGFTPADDVSKLMIRERPASK